MTRLGFLPVACLLFAAALASAQQPASGRSFHDRYAELVANPRRLSDSTRLGELFRVNWEYVMTEFPEFATRSEEHTSELQSQSNLVCRLLLEKKNCGRGLLDVAKLHQHTLPTVPYPASAM